MAADKRSDDKNIFQAENVIVHKTAAQGTQSPGVGHAHEERDVPIGALAKAAGYLVVFTVLICLGLWGLFEFYAAQSESADPELSPLAERRTPPGPRLQSNPAREMAAFRQKEDSAVAAAGMANDGTRRVSVEEAMTMIAERGLPRFVPSGTQDTIPGAGGATAGSATTAPAATAPATGAPASGTTTAPTTPR